MRLLSEIRNHPAARAKLDEHRSARISERHGVGARS